MTARGRRCWRPCPQSGPPGEPASSHSSPLQPPRSTLGEKRNKQTAEGPALQGHGPRQSHQGSAGAEEANDTSERRGGTAAATGPGAHTLSHRARGHPPSATGPGGGRAHPQPQGRGEHTLSHRARGGHRAGGSTASATGPGGAHPQSQGPGGAHSLTLSHGAGGGEHTLSHRAGDRLTSFGGLQRAPRPGKDPLE